MIRFFLRTIGLFVLAAAFAALLYDGTKSIAASQLYITPLDQIWTQIHGASLQWLQGAAERYGPQWLWNPVAKAMLSAPACVVLAIIGAVLLLLGRKKKPTIGYARR
jgi:peptidoglycan/LPS O-acetylase OafA/YrhL